jgi:PIN domain nuclease of toxin-antitoxin system
MMRILLDTHVFLWVVSDSPKLNQTARTQIENAAEVFVSVASLWEISIKAVTGKIDGDVEAMACAIQESGFYELPVRASHAAQLSRLPLLNGHKDPFDRLLVAQSMVEPLVLLTADAHLAAYGGLIRTV